MGVFSGIEILFFFLGVLTTTGVFGIIHMKRALNACPITLALSATGLFLLIFTTAWCVSSILEKEHQAANMGILFFGLPAVMLLGIAWKRMTKKIIKKA